MRKTLLASISATAVVVALVFAAQAGARSATVFTGKFTDTESSTTS